jgi:VPDSG-CTERM motif
MKFKLNNNLAHLAAGVCAVALLTVPSFAVPTLTLFDGTTTVTIVDGGVGDQGGTLGVPDGFVLFIGTIGVWDNNVAVGITKPIMGTSTDPQMALSSDNHSTGAGTLIITFSDTGFDTPGGQLSSELGGTQNAGATTTLVTFQDANVLSSIGALSGTPMSGTAIGTVVASTNWTLSEQVTIVHTEGGTTSFNAQSDKFVRGTSVPDGGAAVGLLGLAFVVVESMRRKMIAV